MSPPEDRSDPVEWLQWFATTQDGAAAYVRDVLTSAGAVVAVGIVLFAVSGIWPPMVAVESPSMTPHMKTGDLVFVVEEGRFEPDTAYDGTGVVTARTGENVGYTEFEQPGDVIVYTPNGSDRQTPIIHRARFWVNDSENWYSKANPEFLAGADACETDEDPETDTGLNNCPAPHAGFITKGDANPQYDQVGVNAISSPVRPKWVTGTAEFRIPYLGWIRLAFAESAAEVTVFATVQGKRSASY